MNPVLPFPRSLFLGFAALLVGCSSGSPNAPGPDSNGDSGTTATTPVDSGSTAPSSKDGSSSGGGDGGSPGGTVGAVCSASAPCGTGLTCAESGLLLGRCTADCSSNLDLCSTQFGASAVCMNASQCALVCEVPSQCPGEGECTPLSSGLSACITNPNGPPDAAPPPNGGCYNLGGAFGDIVANGGYRCDPDAADGGAVTAIDKCDDGVWVPSYNCSCQAAGGPSDCTDFTAAGGAQCEYAFQVCAQCLPGQGCQTQ
jgi:hypothetical protein